MIHTVLALRSCDQDGSGICGLDQERLLQPVGRHDAAIGCSGLRTIRDPSLAWRNLLQSKDSLLQHTDRSEM